MLQQPLKPLLHFLYPALCKTSWASLVGWTEEWPRGLAGSTRISLGGGKALQGSVFSPLRGRSSDVKVLILQRFLFYFLDRMSLSNTD